MDETTTPAPIAAPPNNGAVNGSRAIDYVRSAFFRTREALAVPEWPAADGTPLEIFFTPITAANMNEVNTRTSVMDPITGIPKPTATVHERNIVLFIMKARDDANAPLFQWGDKDALLAESDYAVITRVVQAMNDCGAVRALASVDEAKAILGSDAALHFRMSLADYLKKSLDDIEAMPLQHLTLWAAFLALKAAREDAENPA